MKTSVISGEKRKEQLKDLLVGIAESVNEKDKALAVYTLDVSLSTINKYLKGEVGNMATADQLYQLFTSELKKRA
jgi:hypothetical protein